MKMNREFVQKTINELLPEGLESAELMDSLLERFKMHYGRPVTSIRDISQRENRKIKGDILETFCQLYFETIQTKKDEQFYVNTWLLDEIPDQVREHLELSKRDLGIDLILEDLNGDYYAVQVKYRQHPKYKSKNVIGWKQLSTFYALVNRTGGADGYKKHIIFTNADFVRHVGKKDPRDRTYAIGTLRKIKKDHWLRMAGIEGHSLDSEPVKKLSQDELREARLKKLG